MNNSASKIKLASIDDLLGVPEPHRAAENGIVRLPLERCMNLSHIRSGWLMMRRWRKRWHRSGSMECSCRA